MTDNGKADDDVAVVVLRRVDTQRANARRPRRHRANPSQSSWSRAHVVRPKRGLHSRRWPIRSRQRSTSTCPCWSASSSRTACVTPGFGRSDLIRLRVEASDRVIRLEVSDPGEGFSADLPEPAPKGTGRLGPLLDGATRGSLGGRSRRADGPRSGWRWTSTLPAPAPGLRALGGRRLVDELDVLRDPGHLHHLIDPVRAPDHDEASAFGTHALVSHDQRA